jgi:hypothetical protein
MADSIATLHLEADDEITAAFGRLRSLSQQRAVLVLAPGSRIGTSRINFMLLAREAEERGMTIAAVSDDVQVRALARSAGVAAFDSLGLAQEWFAGGSRGVTLERGVSSEPSVATTAAAEPPARRRGAGRDERSGGGLRRRLIGVAIAALVLAAVVGGGAWAAWFVLPTATITLRPPLGTEGPISIGISADPNVAVVDATAGVVPARRVELPLSVNGTFSATGVKVTQTKATGRVRFESENTAAEYRIPSGTVVATPGGVQFETLAPVTVPKAVFSTKTPGRVSVDVAAVRTGPGGNVAAGSISVLPSGLRDGLLSVTNLAATSGGSRTEEPQATQQDYDQARASLAEQIPAALAAALADPANTPPGLTIYPASAVAGEPSAQPAESDVVGAQGAQFSLNLTVTATVLAVDETLVDQLAADNLRAGLPGDHVLVGAVNASHELVGASPSAIHYRAQASGRSYLQPPTQDLMAQVRGRSIYETRAILSPYGAVEIDIWPGFVDRLPDQPTRLTLNVVPPTVEVP